MNFKCPRCSFEADVRDVFRDRDLVEIIRMVPEFGVHHKLVWEYAELFDTTKPMKWKKMLRLLSEIREIWNANRFSLNKRVYTISREGMAAAMKAVCNRSFSAPLTNHNYLARVMVTVAEAEEAKRSAAAEKELKEKEARLRAGARETSSPCQGEDGRGEGKPAPIGDVVKKGLPWRKEE